MRYSFSSNTYINISSFGKKDRTERCETTLENSDDDLLGIVSLFDY